MRHILHLHESAVWFLMMNLIFVGILTVLSSYIWTWNTSMLLYLELYTKNRTPRTARNYFATCFEHASFYCTCHSTIISDTALVTYKGFDL